MLILRLVLFCTILQLLLGAYPSAKSCQHFQQNAYMKKFIGEGLVRQSPHSGIGQLHTSLHARVDPSFVWYIRYIVHGYTTRIYQVYIYIWIRHYNLPPTPRLEGVAEIGRAHGLAARISPCVRLRSTVWLYVPCCSSRHAAVARWITSCCGNRKGLGS